MNFFEPEKNNKYLKKILDDIRKYEYIVIEINKKERGDENLHNNRRNKRRNIMPTSIKLSEQHRAALEQIRDRLEAETGARHTLTSLISMAIKKFIDENKKT